MTQGFKRNSMNYSIFSSPFFININEAPEHVQMEYADFQCASDLEEKFNNFPLLDKKNIYFIGSIHRHAIFMMSLFHIFM